MASDKERRVVAARLRSKKPEETTFPFDKPVLMHIFRSVFPNQMFLTNWILRLPYQLADLIDRPTTTLTEDEDGRTCCANCGCAALYMSDATYCPDCGAEVVKGV